MANRMQGRESAPPIGARLWSQFNHRRGTGPEPFELRLARARLLFLRRRELSANWLALVVVLGFHVVLGMTNFAAATSLEGISRAVCRGNSIPGLSPRGDAIRTNHRKKPLSQPSRER
jgi:hypothetical protein